MAKSKDDIKYATAQAKLSEDEALRVSYKAGTPLEGVKIADSEPVDLFSSARHIAKQQAQEQGKIADSEPVDLFSSARHIAKQQAQEQGKIADSEPVDLFSSARNIEKPETDSQSSGDQPQPQR